MATAGTSIHWKGLQRITFSPVCVPLGQQRKATDSNVRLRWMLISQMVAQQKKKKKHLYFLTLWFAFVLYLSILPCRMFAVVGCLFTSTKWKKCFKEAPMEKWIIFSTRCAEAFFWTIHSDWGHNSETTAILCPTNTKINCLALFPAIVLLVAVWAEVWFEMLQKRVNSLWQLCTSSQRKIRNWCCFLCFIPRALDHSGWMLPSAMSQM